MSRELHPPVIPDGYWLTTRLMRDKYWHESQGCPPGDHAHPEHLVFWPQLGTESVRVAGQEYNLSVGEGVWVPAGVEHSVVRSRASALAVLHILPSAWEEGEPKVEQVVFRAALREMLLYLALSPMPKPQRLRAQRVCLELLADEAYAEFEVVIPQDGRISAIVEALMTDPSDKRSIEEWAWGVSLSSRTVARVFQSATGMTFNEWRIRIRIMRAMELLGDGLPVGEVARRVGYSTIGAFSNAFYRVVGRRPQEFHPTRA